jgi:hypothetical protein
MNWNQFRTKHKGKGYTLKQLSSMYKKSSQKKASKKGSQKKASKKGSQKKASKKSSQKKASKKDHIIRLKVCNKIPTGGINLLTCVPPNWKVGNDRKWDDGKLPSYKSLGIDVGNGTISIPDDMYINAINT